MLVVCQDNAGFEDTRRVGYTYKVLDIGENSYLIHDSKGKERWVGMVAFKVSRLGL